MESTTTAPVDTSADPITDTERAAAAARLQGYVDAANATVLPAWLEGADEEERRELEDLGVTATGTVNAEEDRDALVSTLLRAVSEHEQDVARFNAAEAQEHSAIRQRYERLRQPAVNQLQRIGAYLKFVVSGSQFPGKKKSRSVGWGSYGLRKQPDAVTVTDAPAMLAWMQEHQPALLTIDVTISVADAQDLLNMTTDMGLQSPVLAQIMAAHTAQDFGYAKNDLKALVLGKKDPKGAVLVAPAAVPGVVVAIGADDPYYKVEAPIHG